MQNGQEAAQILSTLRKSIPCSLTQCYLHHHHAMSSNESTSTEKWYMNCHILHPSLHAGILIFGLFKLNIKIRQGTVPGTPEILTANLCLIDYHI